MQICLDGRIAKQQGGTGVSVYASTLAVAIQGAGFELQILAEGRLRASRARRWLDAALPQSWPAHASSPGDGSAPSARAIAGGFRVAQIRFDMTGRFLTVQDPDDPPAIMHWTYPQPIHFRSVPNIYTVHDLIPLLHPELTSIAQPRMRRMFSRLRDVAAHLVTVSESSRQDVIRELGWSSGRVTNTYQAVLDTPPPAAAVADVLGSLGLTAGEYVLHAGSVEPRKNVRRLVEAYQASGLRIPLILAGPDGWQAAEELRGLADVPGLRRLPWVQRPALLALLCGARFVAAPSLAEGFGLVVAESMTFGTPVLTSSTGALAEIAGSAALLVDPRDGAALAEAMRALDADAGLRADLRARGLRRSGLFTVDAYSDRLRALYTGLQDHSLGRRSGALERGHTDPLPP